MDRHGALTIAWGELERGQRRAEIPDVAGLADLHRAFLQGVAPPRVERAPFPVPKRGGVRMVMLLDPSEEAAYLALGAEAAATIEPSLSPAVVANRADRRLAERGRLRLEPFGRARARWRDGVKRLLAAGPGAVAVADVRDCYGRIPGDVVLECLERTGARDSVVAGLARLLDRWKAAGVAGLPVGPAPSAVLANAVLASVDGAVAREGCRHLRWVDDFAVAAPDVRAADRALERLRAALARLGLQTADEKCRITDGADPSLGAVGDASGLRREQAAPAMPFTRGGPRPPDLDLDLDLATLEAPGEPATALAHLRALRRLARLRLGRAEAGLLRGAALDPARHEQVRAWAWRALAATDLRTCLDRAAGLEDEPSPVIRRAVELAASSARG